MKTADGLTIAYTELYGRHGGLTTGTVGDSVRSVVVPVGGSTPVKAVPKGSGNTTPFPEDVIFAHEAYGHGLHALDPDAIKVENEYRKSRNPPLVERSGEDHQFEVNGQINPPDELLSTPTVSPSTNITPRPLIPLPTKPPHR